MTSKAQVIFDGGRPAFVVVPYKDYVKLTGELPEQCLDDAEFVPFVLSDYIRNPIRLKRIEAGLNQLQLASLLGVTQGYVSRIESRDYVVSETLMTRVVSVLSKKRATPKKHAKSRNSKRP